MRASNLLLLLVPALAGCKDDLCFEGTSWSSGQQAFRDATSDWGLDELHYQGVRISAVDFDGDGWTDLVIRYGDAPDDDSAPETRTTWLLRNTGQGSFEDVTYDSGAIAARYEEGGTRGGETWAFGDVDNDGDLDAFVGLADLDDTYEETSEILLNAGDGTFELGPEGSDVRYYQDETPYGASFLDYDLDGNLDLWVAEYYYEQDQLYRGKGNGNFEVVTHDAGLTTTIWSDYDDLNAALAHSVAWSALACDLNNDGYSEMLTASYGRAPNHLWRNEGDGTFTNRSVDSGYAYDDRTDWSDNQSARCWCQLNPDDEDCEGIPEPVDGFPCNSESDAFRWTHEYDRELFRLGGNSGTTVCGDVNNDGWMDLVTTEIVHWDVGSSSDPSELLLNQQDPDVTFERPGNETTGLLKEHEDEYYDDGDMTAAMFDFDNDGWLDVYIGSSDYPGTRGWLYHNNGDETFEAVPTSDGIDHTRSHGVVAADFDRDGDLDVVAGHSSMRCDDDCYDTYNVRFFENIVGEDQELQGNYLQLELVGGSGTNTAAIGARVEVSTDETVQIREVNGGHGQRGYQSDLVQHFGLGAACEAEVTITWPDSGLTTETFTLDANHRYLVEQGGEPVVDDVEEAEE